MNNTRRTKTVDRIMNKDLIMTRRDAALAPVVEMMMRRGMTEIPVVDDDRSLLGFVSRVDLVNPPMQPFASPEEFLGAQQARSSVTCELDHGFRLDVESSATVADVMSASVVAVTPEATAKEAAALMAKNRVTMLPVVSSLGVLIGTVSVLDLVGVLS